ncbi:MAG: RNase adapter RapZ [Synergistaceae bacterium]|nr:RNase adapter RapZ [Synergistaceae bacterium]
MEKRTEIRQCVIVTGMSGAGKTTALKVLEDDGFFAIDNIPPLLLPQLYSMLSDHRAAIRMGLAATIDVRGGRLLDDLIVVLRYLKTETPKVRVLFLNASDEALLSRFEQTRRRHPVGENLSIQEGIRRERLLLSPILESADIVLDTSLMNPQQCRKRVTEEFGGAQGDIGSLLFSSFGFKYGVPQDSNYVFDVRFIPNPFYVAELKLLSGRDEAVKKYLDSFPGTGEFLTSCERFLDFVIPRYLEAGKAQLHVAVGCTGGRHRSVAIVEWLIERYRDETRNIAANHRDLDRAEMP